MAHDELHVDDMSTLEVTLTEDGVATDVSAATLITFKLQKPDKTVISRVGSFLTNGVDGKVKYQLLGAAPGPSDLDIDGPWKLQVVITETTTVFNSAVGKFKVNRNIPV